MTWDFVNLKGSLVAGSVERNQLWLLRNTGRFHLSTRGYCRVLRVARTVADLTRAEKVGRIHIAEALGYRKISFAR